MRRSQQKAKKKKWPWIVGILGLIVIGAGIYLFSIYNSFTNTMDEIHEPLDRPI